MEAPVDAASLRSFVFSVLATLLRDTGAWTNAERQQKQPNIPHAGARRCGKRSRRGSAAQRAVSIRARSREYRGRGAKQHRADAARYAYAAAGSGADSRELARVALQARPRDEGGGSEKVASGLLPRAWVDFRSSGRASAWNAIYTRGCSAASRSAGVAIWATWFSSPQPSRSCAALAPERRQRNGDRWIRAEFHLSRLCRVRVSVCKRCLGG